MALVVCEVWLDETDGGECNASAAIRVVSVTERVVKVYMGKVG